MTLHTARFPDRVWNQTLKPVRLNLTHGVSARLTVTPRDPVQASQPAFLKGPLSALLCSTGHPLPPCSSSGFASEKTEGPIMTWGRNKETVIDPIYATTKTHSHSGPLCVLVTSTWTNSVPRSPCLSKKVLINKCLCLVTRGQG